jgi:hypothetical protein
VAELLLLRPMCALLRLHQEIDQILASLPGANGRPAQRLAAEIDALALHRHQRNSKKACTPG